MIGTGPNVTETDLGGARAATAGMNFGVVSTGDNAQIAQFFGGFERLVDAYLSPAALLRELDLGEDLAGFTGREWLIKKIDDFLRTQDRGYVLVEAPAGLGKTTLLGYLARTRKW